MTSSPSCGTGVISPCSALDTGSEALRNFLFIFKLPECASPRQASLVVDKVVKLQDRLQGLQNVSVSAVKNLPSGVYPLKQQGALRKG